MLGFRDDLQKFQNQFLSTFEPTRTVNDLQNETKLAINTAIDKHVPTKMSTSRFSQPWITTGVKRISRRKKRAYRKAKYSNDDADWKSYRDLNKQSKSTCHTAYNNNVVHVSDDEKSTKKLWSFLSGRKKDTAGVPPLKKDGIKFTDSNAGANILNDQFASVFTS